MTGIDLDASSIDMARAQGSQHGIAYVLGDALIHPFTSESFDVVTSVATLHHMDAGVGLRRMRDLLRPGGTLIVLGLAGSTFREWPLHLLGAIEHRWYTSTRGFWEHPSPQVWPPPVTYPEMRRIATRVLPGARFRRRAVWRYTLIWTKPVRD